jgi:hypothetical protein
MPDQKERGSVAAPELDVVKRDSMPIFIHQHSIHGMEVNIQVTPDRRIALAALFQERLHVLPAGIVGLDTIRNDELRESLVANLTARDFAHVQVPPLRVQPMTTQKPEI